MRGLDIDNLTPAQKLIAKILTVGMGGWIIWSQTKDWLLVTFSGGMVFLIGILLIYVGFKYFKVK